MSRLLPNAAEPVACAIYFERFWPEQLRNVIPRLDIRRGTLPGLLVIAERPKIASANFAIDVVPQLDVDLRVIQAGVFQRSFPTPEWSHRVNLFDQFRVTSFDGGDIERSTARVEALDFTNDDFLRWA